jgi:Protein of unknown function (DUF3489)
MPKTNYQVTTAEGKIETRKSARPYTHVLLGRPDYVALRARMNSKDYANNFAYYTRVAEGRYEWSKWDTAEEIARSVEKAKTEVAGFADAKTYGEAKIAQYIAENCPEGQDQGEEVALRWSQSVANAQGAISEFQGRFYTAFRVVPAEVATKTTNRAGATPGNKESNMNTAATATTEKKTTKKQAAKKATTKKAATKKVAPKTATKVAPKKAAKVEATAPATQTRKGTIATLIQRKGGATLAEIMAATDWQAHSVRGAISTLGKTMKIESGKSESGERTYAAV